MNNGKRLLSGGIAAALVCSLAFPALAAEMPGGADMPQGGMMDAPTMPGQTPGGSNVPSPPPGGGGSAPTSYDAVVTYDKDTTVSWVGEIQSTGKDENAILVTDGAVTMDNLTITRTSNDSTGGDNSSFYGVGAAVLTTGGTAIVRNSIIDTDASGGAGVFAYGDGTALVTDCIINTARNASGGIHVAGGGSLYATNVTATTQGGSAAAIRSDRGGGLMVVEGGAFTSNGTGSPAIYCTAEIGVRDALLTANNSEAVCIEGLNSVYLYDCELTGNMRDDSQNDTTWNVILYQSMSGDSQVGNSTFQMVGGKLTAKNGGMFYTTNTESTFLLKDVDITYPEDSEFLLRCTGNANQRGWGATGENGAQCTFTAIDQALEGNVVWDSISTLDLYLTGESALTGAFVYTTRFGEGDGYANLYIADGSEWVVTGDSVLSNLYCAGTIVAADGKSITIQDKSGKVLVEGDSAYTVTVDTYSEPVSVSESGAGSLLSFEQFVAKNTGSDTVEESEGPGPDPDSAPVIETAGIAPEAQGTAYPSTQTVLVDGKETQFQMYALRGDAGVTYYIKLRDLAAILDGTDAQFNVGWTQERGVFVETGKAYTDRNGQENQSPYSGEQSYTRYTNGTDVDGVNLALQAFAITDDAGGASHYFKLRDLGQALGFNVGFDGTNIFVETDKPYTAND